MSEPCSHPRTVIIAQARMGSTRLPGKVMMDICGKPMVDHVVERANRSTLADDVAVAIPALAEDDVLAEHLVSLDVQVVRGSADDVLARYVKAAEVADADVIVRITCDCPLIDPEIIDAVIERFRESGADYCSNTLVRTYPIGMDTEVFSREALERADREARQPHEREHVTPYVWQGQSMFRLENVEAPAWAQRPEVRLTVDERADLEFVRRICSETRERVQLQGILELLARQPLLCHLNAHVHHRVLDALGGGD